MRDSKRILISGAGGFVGKHLTKHLAGKGFEVFAILRKNSEPADIEYFESRKVRILKHDLSNLNTDSLPANIDKLIILAQSSHFRDFPEKADDIFSVNILSSLRLIQWAFKSKVKQVIQTSSGGIYGGKLGKEFDENDLLTIDTRLGFYLGSKLCSEIIFQNYMKFFNSAIILRPFFIYGPGQREDMFIPRLINSIKKGTPITLNGEVGLHVNPIYIEDVVYAFTNALKLKGSHVINIAGPEVLSLKGLATLIGKSLNKDPVFRYIEGEPVDYVGSTIQSIEKLGQPQTPLSKGISKTIGAQK